VQGQNIDIDGNQQLQMEERRVARQIGRKARKPQNGSDQNSLQEAMSKPFTVHSVSNWNIDIALYV
jgi:hypothetical protein